MHDLLHEKRRKMSSWCMGRYVRGIIVLDDDKERKHCVLGCIISVQDFLFRLNPVRIKELKL